MRRTAPVGLRAPHLSALRLVPHFPLQRDVGMLGRLPTSPRPWKQSPLAAGEEGSGLLVGRSKGTLVEGQ